MRLPWWNTRISLLRLVVVLSLSFGVNAAMADEPIEDDFSEWRPQFDAGFGVHSQIVRSFVDRSTGVSGRGSRDILTSVFKFNVGISSPGLIDGFGRPRVYARVGYHYVLADEVRIFDTNVAVSEGEYLLDPSRCGVVQDPITASCDHSISIDVEIDNLWSAGVGLEFAGKFWEQEFKISTGIEYLGQEISFRGTARKNDRTGEGDFAPGRIVSTRILPDAEKTVIIHTLGPRVGLAASVGQVGPVAIQFFADLSFYFYLNDDDITFASSNAGDTASYRVEKQTYLTQGTGGLRFVWH